MKILDNESLTLLDHEFDAISLQRKRDHDAKMIDYYTHKQVFMVGEDYTVDEGIYNLVLAVNKLGLVTQFSCEGSIELLDSHHILNNSNYMSHLIFGELEHAFKFYKLTTDYLGSLWTSSDGATFSITALKAYDKEKSVANKIEFSSVGARGMVKFHPRNLSTVTELWCKLAAFDNEA